MITAEIFFAIAVLGALIYLFSRSTFDPSIETEYNNQLVSIRNACNYITEVEENLRSQLHTVLNAKTLNIAISSEKQKEIEKLRAQLENDKPNSSQEALKEAITQLLHFEFIMQAALKNEADNNRVIEEIYHVLSSYNLLRQNFEIKEHELTAAFNAARLNKKLEETNNFKAVLKASNDLLRKYVKVSTSLPSAEPCTSAFHIDQTRFNSLMKKYSPDNSL